MPVWMAKTQRPLNLSPMTDDAITRDHYRVWETGISLAYLWFCCNKLNRLITCNICDMIKGNESDIRNIDIELQAKRGDKLSHYILHSF